MSLLLKINLQLKDLNAKQPINHKILGLVSYAKHHLKGCDKYRLLHGIFHIIPFISPWS
jgi:hypothetical protein